MVCAAQDPRAERFWDLVAAIRKAPPSPIGPAYRYLFDALRARVAATPQR